MHTNFRECTFFLVADRDAELPDTVRGSAEVLDAFWAQVEDADEDYVAAVDAHYGHHGRILLSEDNLLWRSNPE
jgi:hypothetical protein